MSWMPPPRDLASGAEVSVLRVSSHANIVYSFAVAKPGGDVMSKLVDQTPMRRSIG